MRNKGKIADWNEARGFGFIQPFDGGSQVFVHIKAIANRNRRPRIGEVVTYAVGKDSRGRLRAEKVNVTGGKLGKKRIFRGNAPAITAALLFLAVVGISALFTDLPSLLPAAYLITSFITYVAYAVDKSAARSGGRRTSERTLHILSLIGGWPGALVAQKTLRHKSKKASFRVVFWATVIANCAAFCWLHTEDGQRSFDELLSAGVVGLVRTLA